MKKLAILAAAAAGYVLANRLGPKPSKTAGSFIPEPPRYEPAGTDPFIASAPTAPVAKPKTPVIDDVIDEPAIEAPEEFAFEASTHEDVNAASGKVDGIVDAEPEAVAELDAVPERSVEAESEETPAESAEPVIETKLSEVAEGIVERVQTAAELAREDEFIEGAELASEDAPDIDAELRETVEPEAAFIVPTAEDFADETFPEDAVEPISTDAPSDDVDPVSVDEELLAETALMEAIGDEELGKE